MEFMELKCIPYVEDWRCLKPALKALSRRNYSDIQKRIVEAREVLLDIQKVVLSFPTNELLATKHAQSKRLADLCMIEESLMRQKSRVQWIKEGDQNTGFFYRVVKMR